MSKTKAKPVPAPAPGRGVLPEARVLLPLRNAFVGIDPGRHGAIAWIQPDGTAHALVTPILEFTNGKWDFDREEMRDILSMLEDSFVAIEKVSAAPMRGRVQGTSSMWNFGRGYGLWLGMLSAMNIPYVEVDPRKWKKAILSGTAKDKAAAIGYAQTVFPGVDLRATPRSRKPSDGKSDALCLAEYARREWKTRQILKGSV